MTAALHPHVPPPDDAARRPDEPQRVERIGAAAARIGVSPSALRLWERQGLVHPARSPAGYRLYSPADLVALARVRRLRQTEQVNAPGIRLLDGLHDRRQGRGPVDAAVQGTRLRELRRGRELSLKAAAASTGLSVSYLSAVERGLSGASVAALQRLTSAYRATLLDLFAAPAAAGVQRLVRPGERPVLRVAGPAVRIEQLSRGAQEMEPQLFVLAPGASSEGNYAHPGEEFIYVLEGRATFWLGDDEAYRLTPGDALTFPSSLPHRWSNESDHETRLLWINTPPTF